MYTLGGIFGLGWIMVYDLWLDMIWLGLEWVWHRQKEIFGGFYLFYSWACLNCLLFWLHLTLVKQVSLGDLYPDSLSKPPRDKAAKAVFLYFASFSFPPQCLWGAICFYVFFVFFLRIMSLRGLWCYDLMAYDLTNFLTLLPDLLKTGSYQLFARIINWLEFIFAWDTLSFDIMGEESAFEFWALFCN